MTLTTIIVVITENEVSQQAGQRHQINDIAEANRQKSIVQIQDFIFLKSISGRRHARQSIKTMERD